MANVRPTTILLGADNRKRWSKWDIVLVQAKQVLEAERCGQCGNPKWVCQNPDNDIEYQFHKEVCFATQALNKYEKTEEKKRKKNGRRGAQADDEPVGEAAYPSAYRVSGAELGDLRDGFYEAESERRKAMLASRPGHKPTD